MSLRDTSPWRATNSEECDVVWRNRYFCLHARLESLLLMSWCTMIELGDITRPAVDSSKPSDAVHLDHGVYEMSDKKFKIITIYFSNSGNK